ncbi:MAG: DUF4382 domain-containing protein [archaeon]|nr:DUF4382 domain-containing protein [archaeon]MCP8314550.1 DUF4382 domain-containing protein [archaeon]MCP8318032.1 DUF4382 domain-containing protein [archaeon]MCP8320819.1 DUF4382 domain-containing protein [archaeon]
MAYERKHLVISAIAGVLLAGLIIAGTILLPYISEIITPPTEVTSIPDDNPPEITTPPPITEPSKMGTLVLMLTDAPPRDLEKLNITIDEVRLRMEGNKTGEGPVVDFSLDEPKKYDITTLSGILDEIGNNEVPEGKYVAIWLHIINATATFKNNPNEIVNLTVVAQGWLKIQPLHFEVKAGSLTVVILDFDLGQTHVSNGDILRPVIKLKKVLGP